MGKVSDLTPRTTAGIKTLLKTETYSNRKIARKFLISESSVRRIKKKFESGKELIAQRKQKCGRKRKFTPRGKRCLQKICLEDRFASLKQIKSKLEDSGISVCERTVRRQLSEMGFATCRPAKKPKLTKSARQKRLKWAQELKRKDLEFWRSVSTLIFHSVQVLYLLATCFVLL